MKPLYWGSTDGGRDTAGADGLSLVKILRVLRRRKIMIVSMVLAASGGTYAAVSHMPPRYTAETTIMIEPRKSQALDVKSGIPQVALDASTIRTEAEVLRSLDLAHRVATRLNLVHEQEFGRKPSRVSLLIGSVLDVLPQSVSDAALSSSWLKGIVDPADLPRAPVAAGARAPKVAEQPLPSFDDVVERLQDNLTISNDGRSAIIKVRFEAADPKLGAAIVNTYANAYIEDQLADKSAAIVRASELLNQRVEELRKVVLDSDRDVQTFRDENRLTEARGMTVTAQQLAETNTLLTNARAELSQKEANLSQLKAMESTGQGPEAAMQIMSSPMIVDLKNQQVQVLRHEAELLGRYDISHPALREVENEKAELQKRIDAEMADIVSGLTNDVEAARAREVSLQDRLSDLERKAHELDQAQVHLRQLEREANANHELYEHFLTRSKETSVQKYFEEADARILSSAVVPKTATFPQTARIVELAAVASLIAALALAMLLEKFDHTFTSVEELEHESDVLSFGMIPEVGRGRGSPKMILEFPTSAFSEAVRWVRTSLDLTVAQRAKVVMVTSSISREGKTTLSTSLGRSAAQSGQRVLLIDCDLRLGKIAKVFETKPSLGLDAFVKGEADISEIIHRDQASGLDYVTTAVGTPNPQALLGSVQMESLLQRMRTSYDLIILDSPPVLAVSDALIIAKLADATILLVRWNATLRSSAVKALRELRKVGGNVVGVVLTRVDQRKNATYGYTGPEPYQSAKTRATAPAVLASAVRADRVE